ncbi:flagellar protein FlgN [Hahella sp. SMD15-11]|uniref:Flagellar protein FlgN n=1 Tax=Thermohahella caldifontis TaxID=3142973 RepID=A0AB39UZV4_9GAMM
MSDLKQFHAQLQNDLSLLASLLRTLEAERACLEQGDLDTLQTLTQTKLDLMQSLDASARARSQWLARVRLSPERLRTILASRFPSIHDKLLESEARLAQCKHLNEVNGRIIVAARQRTDRVLRIIKGQPDRPVVYGREAKTEHVPGTGHALGIA